MENSSAEKNKSIIIIIIDNTQRVQSNANQTKHRTRFMLVEPSNLIHPRSYTHRTPPTPRTNYRQILTRIFV